MFSRYSVHYPLHMALVMALLSSQAQAFDQARAESLAKQSNCFKCHLIDKKKESTSWHDIAVKYRSKPEAHDKLTFHLTSGEKVKFDDGHEENHKIVKSTDPVEIKNLIDWILSL